MRVNRIKKTLAIPSGRVEREGGVVVLSLGEYRRLLENSVPAVYLKGRRARALDRLVTEGLKEHFEGKTKKVKSLADLD